MKKFLTIVPALAFVIILSITMLAVCGDNDMPDDNGSVNKPDPKKR